MLRRLSCYFKQNVIAFIALFFAMAGGTAYALDGTNTVFNDDIVNDQVTTADVRDDNLAFGGLYQPDLGPGSVGTSEVANNSLGNGDFLTGSVDNRVVTDNSLTGTDINESSLNLPPTTTTTFAGAGSVNLDNNDGFTGVVTKNLAAGSYAIAATANIATNDVRVEDSYNALASCATTARSSAAPAIGDLGRAVLRARSRSR